jgi:hypothetical protein
MKTFIVSLLIAGLLTYPAVGESQTNDGLFDDGIFKEDTGLGSGHSPFDSDGGHEEQSLDFDQTPTDAPIDGGLSVLLIAGAAYGVKKIAVNRAKTKAPK